MCLRPFIGVETYSSGLLDENDVTALLIKNEDLYINMDESESDNDRDDLYSFEQQISKILDNPSFSPEEKSNYTNILVNMKNAFIRRDVLSKVNVLQCLKSASQAQDEAIKRSSHVDVATAVMNTNSPDTEYISKQLLTEPPTLSINQSDGVKEGAS